MGETMEPLLSMGRAKVLVDGIFTEPRIAHPEGLAIDSDGKIWCGTETGDLIRVDPDNPEPELMGSTDGFSLGLAFDAADNCFVCDLKHAAIFRREMSTGRTEKFASSGILVPNYPVVDEARGWLYVSDSHGLEQAGPGIYRYALATGEGGLWYDKPMVFANGMALAPDGGGLYVVESFAQRVSYVPIRPDGSPGEASVVVEDVQRVPDGLAFAHDGTMYISCYEPSRIYRFGADKKLELLIDDPQATTLAHPTNIALLGNRMFTANLGRWHITEIAL
ncbi:MAG: SMP-30/gluconolactonase/LRE family protein [Pseudomonadota bacterium]